MPMMVIEKPMQLTIVSDVPFDAGCAFCATSVENSGESAITAIPQINIKITSATGELLNNSNGEIKQQRHDMDRAIVAVRLAPSRCDINPLNTQANEPDAIIKKDSNGILKSITG